MALQAVAGISDCWALGLWCGARTGCRCSSASDVWQQLVLVEGSPCRGDSPVFGGSLSQSVEILW